MGERQHRRCTLARPLIGAIDDQHPPSFNFYWKGEKKKVEGFGRFTTTRGGAYCYLPET